MKAIVHIIKNDCKNPARRVSYLANKDVLVGPWISNDVRLNTENLMCNHHGRGRKTRHLVISLEKGADLEDSLFEKVAERFVGTFAPGSAWLGAIDRCEKKCVHMHLVLANVNEAGTRTLRFGPAQLRQMQDINSWSSGLLESGRRGFIQSKCNITKLIGGMTHEEIRNNIENGCISVGRCNSKGQVSSIIAFGCRRTVKVHHLRSN